MKQAIEPNRSALGNHSEITRILAKIMGLGVKVKVPSDYILCITDGVEVVKTCSFLSFTGRPYNLVSFHSRERLLNSFTVLTVLSLTLDNYRRFFAEISPNEKRKLFPLICLINDDSERRVIQELGGSFFISDNESTEDIQAKLRFIEQLSVKIREFAEVERQNFARQVLAQYNEALGRRLRDAEANPAVDALIKDLTSMIETSESEFVCVENAMEALIINSSAKLVS